MAQKDVKKIHFQVVVGLGKTGLSCVRYLAAQQLPVAVTDSREQPPGLAELLAEFPAIHLALGQFDTELCSQASRLIISPGVSLQEPAIAAAIANGVPAIGDIELFAQKAKAPVIGITGSNGKSTVTALVTAMAEAAQLNVRVGGNFGTPALELLTSPEPDLYVLELSSFQLETTSSLQTVAATILNLSEDHMDRYPDLDAYLRAKQRIFQHCATAIVNRDDPITCQDISLSSTVSFGLSVPQPGQFGLREKNERYYLAYGEQCLLATEQLRIKGYHNIANALAALALAHTAGISQAGMLAALQNFPGLPHRCQWVGCHQGVTWYNDSKATNVGAAVQAIMGLGADIKGKLVVIAGGIGKHADFSPLCTPLKNYGRHLILIGQDAPQMQATLQHCITTSRADSLEHAIHLARDTARAEDAVLLAPACASMDMFDNFEHRGNAFMQAVKALW